MTQARSKNSKDKLIQWVGSKEAVVKHPHLLFMPFLVFSALFGFLLTLSLLWLRQPQTMTRGELEDCVWGLYGALLFLSSMGLYGVYAYVKHHFTFEDKP